LPEIGNYMRGLGGKRGRVSGRKKKESQNCLISFS